MSGLNRALGRFVRSRPDLVAVEEELSAEKKQPEKKREAKRTPWNPRAEDRPANRSDRASCNQLQQQARVGGVREPMRAAADERNEEPEGNIRPNHLRRQKCRKAKQRSASQSTCAG